MHGINNGKVIKPQKVRIIHHYKNGKDKLIKKAALWVNKMCRLKHLMELCKGL